MGFKYHMYQICTKASKFQTCMSAWTLDSSTLCGTEKSKLKCPKLQSCSSPSHSWCPLQPGSPHWRTTSSFQLLRQELASFPAPCTQSFRFEHAQRMQSLLTTSFYHSGLSFYHFLLGFTLGFNLWPSTASSEQRIRTCPWEIKRNHGISSAWKPQVAVHFGQSNCHGADNAYR